MVARPELRKHVGFMLILSAFIPLGVLYLRATPLLETPDEPSHFSLVKYIADEVGLPPARPALPEAGPAPVILPGSPVYYAPPLYYVLGAPLIAGLDTAGFATNVIPNPNWARGWAPTPSRSSQNKNFYVHTADQRPPFAGWAVAMLRLRIFSLLLGGVTVGGVYALARTIWTTPVDTSWVFATTALVAFNPAFLFTTIGVTNDALLIALSTWAFVLMARLVSRGPDAGSGLVLSLGITLGLAALTKQSALAFVPAAILAVAWAARSKPEPRRMVPRWLLLLAVLITLLAGGWYLNNTLTYGDPLGFEPHRPPAGGWHPSLSLLVRQFGQALQSYWAVFGWGLILVEPVVYLLFAVFVLIGLLGCAMQPAGRKSRLTALLALGVLFNLIGLLLWLWRTSAPYGRLLFPTLGPVAVLLVVGWRRWLGTGRGRIFASVVALTLGLFAAIVPWRYLRPAYASSVVSTSAFQEATALDVRFGEAIRLLAFRAVPTSARPGEQVKLTLYWQTDKKLDSDVMVFVQLAPTDPERWVAGFNDYLGSPRYPTGVWQAGEVIEQVYQLQLPDDVPTPSLYWFGVGLCDEPGGERLPGTADGAPLPGGTVRLGTLRVLDRENRQPFQEVNFRLGSSIRLIGYDLEVSQTDAITVTLFWKAEAAREESWTVFVHLLDQDGRVVAQHDGLPRQGAYPTWAWQEGDLVPDSHTLQMPSNHKPGTYRLLTGLYRSGDGIRVPVFDQVDRRVPNDAAILTDINLAEESDRNGD